MTGYLVGEYDVKTRAASSELALSVRGRDSTETKPVTCFEFIVANPDTLLPDLPPFYPAQEAPRNQAMACIQRFGCEMPVPEGGASIDFLCYCKELVLKHFPMLQHGDKKTFQEWLDGLKFNLGRKEVLSELRDTQLITDETLKCQAFIKWESYTKPKHPRAINSYSDESKSLLGPLIKSLEKCIFGHFGDVFVKGTNPRDWPKRMEQIFGRQSVMETDFTAFESHHNGVFAEVVHFAFMHVLRGAGLSNHESRLISRLMRGVNVCEFKHVTATIPERLMSGALWTSLGNGVLNFMIMSYLNNRALFPDRSPQDLAANYTDGFTGLIEGDDGICLARDVPQQLIDSLGIVLKFEKHEWFGEASFCGCVCDAHSLSVVQDPFKVLRNFCSLPASYAQCSRRRRLEMLRAKALSYTVVCPNAPIVRVFMDRVLYLTRGLDVRRAMSETDRWKIHLIEQALEERVWATPANINDSVRETVHKRFGIDLAEQQRIEEAIAQWDGGDLLLDLSMYATDDDVKQTLTHFNDDVFTVSPPEHLPYTPTELDGALRGCRKKKSARVRHGLRWQPLPVVGAHHDFIWET